MALHALCDSDGTTTQTVDAAGTLPPGWTWFPFGLACDVCTKRITTAMQSQFPNYVPPTSGPNTTA